MSNPDNTRENRALLAAGIRASLRKAGLHIVPAPVIEALVDHAVAAQNDIRGRITQMVESCAARYETGMDQEQIERLALVVSKHYIDGKGQIQLPDLN